MRPCLNQFAEPNRRDFAGFAISAAAAGAILQIKPPPAMADSTLVGRELIGRGSTILFQGDSITDAGRDRSDKTTFNRQSSLGNGYAWLAASDLLVNRRIPELKIFNRGISGNRVRELNERWKGDCIDLKPSVLSILIGVNDIWHTLEGKFNSTAETYQRDFSALIGGTLESLPGVQLVVCEPFVLRCGGVGDHWFPDFDAYRAASLRVAEVAGAVFVPFQEMFNRAVEFAPPEHWTNDGVHPTAAGAALMASYWLQSVGTSST